MFNYMNHGGHGENKNTSRCRNKNIGILHCDMNPDQGLQNMNLKFKLIGMCLEIRKLNFITPTVSCLVSCFTPCSPWFDN